VVLPAVVVAGTLVWLRVPLLVAWLAAFALFSSMAGLQMWVASRQRGRRGEASSATPLPPN